MDINHIFNLFGGDPKKYTEEPPSTINIEQFEKKKAKKNETIYEELKRAFPDNAMIRFKERRK